MKYLKKLAQEVNYQRRELRPQQLADLQLELDARYAHNNFFRGDVRVKKGNTFNRHLIFASDRGIKIAKNLRR